MSLPGRGRKVRRIPQAPPDVSVRFTKGCDQKTTFPTPAPRCTIAGTLAAASSGNAYGGTKVPGGFVMLFGPEFTKMFVFTWFTNPATGLRLVSARIG